ncbi:MAG: hypothetical protein AAFO95_07110 [Cyanobacteria bacterium J06600_6]
MRSCFNLLGISIITAATAMSTTDRAKVLAIGCDTYYRVTGQIAGCTDISTEKAREAWIQKYSVCLERQLNKEIVLYRGKLQTYYAEGQPEDGQQDWEFDRPSFSNIDRDDLSISSTTYRGNADFCPD